MTLLRLFLLVTSLSFVVSCGTFHKPQFRGPGELISSTKRNRPVSIVDNIQIQWPVKNLRVTQHFKPGSRKSRHQGIDFGGRKNTPIYAAHEGKVIYTGSGFTGYGNLVIVEHPSGYATFYAHLNKIETREGRWVTTGEQIGRMGRTGRATGVHLHFELRIAEVAVNPLNYVSKSSLQALRD